MDQNLAKKLLPILSSEDFNAYTSYLEEQKIQILNYIKTARTGEEALKHSGALVLLDDLLALKQQVIRKLQNAK